MSQSLVLSLLDGTRLSAVLAQFGRTSTAYVRLELARKIRQSHLRPPAEMPPHVITMNSRALLVGDAWPAPRECHLVYPDEANCLENKISVLSPLGVRLLGGIEGETIQVWDGRRAMRVYLVALTYQPEAAKHWHR